MSSSITLPSGLSGVIRGLKVAEANLLANAMEQRKGTALDGVYANVWEATTEAGVYEEVPGAIGPDGKPRWNKVLVCDRFALMLAVRVATYGAEYSFKCKCGSCGEKYDWELDLSTLEKKDLPAHALESFKNGNRMAATFPSTGVTFWFRLVDGDGEKMAERLMKQNSGRKLTAALASRIIEITGVHGGDKLKYLDNLEMRDANAVLDILDESDGGVETRVEVTCPTCGEAQDLDLPFGKEFWVPSRSRTRGVTATDT